MLKIKKIILTFSIIIVMIGVYVINDIIHDPIVIVKASSNLEIEDNNATEFIIGNTHNIEYEMDFDNDINNIYMLYRVKTTNTGMYTIDINNVPEDNDTYIDVSIFDFELNEYGTFSTIQWDENTENNIYFNEYSYDIELLGDKTYYILICCNSHEYKDVYSGNIDFSFNLERIEMPEKIEDGYTYINSLYNKTVYRTISVDSDGWYKLVADLNDSNASLRVYNGEQLILGTDNTYFLNKNIDYHLYISVYNESIECDSEINFGITVNKIDSLSIGEYDTITYSNNAICTYTALKNSEISIFSKSENADPRIIVLNNDIEIICGDDTSLENSKDYKIALEVEANETYTLLLSDNLESSENIDVTIQPCDIGADGNIELHSPEPSNKPGAEVTFAPTPTATPGVTASPSSDIVSTATPDATASPPSGIVSTATPDATANPSSGSMPTPTQNVTSSPNNEPNNNSVINSINKRPKKIVIKSIIKGKKKCTIKFKKVKYAKKYIVEYSTKKNFKKRDTKTVITKSNKATIKKLKHDKKYYIRVRAKGNGKIKGKWSKIHTVKI